MYRIRDSAYQLFLTLKLLASKKCGAGKYVPLNTRMTSECPGYLPISALFLAYARQNYVSNFISQMPFLDHQKFPYWICANQKVKFDMNSRNHFSTGCLN